MNAVTMLFTLLLSFSIPCAILLIIYAVKRQSMPGAKYFILVLISAIIYNGAYIGEINSNTLSAAMFWYNLEHVAIPFQQYFWLLMSLEYVRLHSSMLNKAKYIMLYHPILFIIIFFTNKFHHLYVSSISFVSNGYFPVIITAKGPLYLLMVASGTLMGIIATAYYVLGYMKSPKIHRRCYFIMIIASLFPWICVYLNAFNKSFLGVDYYPVVSIASGILYMYGIFKFKIFNIIPIATETVFRQSKEGIAMVDMTDRIIDVNDFFLNIYPELSGRNGKCTLTEFINSHTDLGPVMSNNAEALLSMEIDGITRHFHAEIRKILADNEFQIGKFLVITDISLYMENQKRLESIASDAINKAESKEISFLQAQIKPHFLNNTLSVIGSMITRDPEEAKALIGNLGEYLVKCCYFDSSAAFVSLENELETVKTYVSIEKARFRERLEFNLLCKSVPEIFIPRLVLQPLVENAIRHGILKKADGGNVWLKIYPEKDKVYFEISDDGIGMSEEKVRILTADENGERGIGILNIHKRLIKYYGQGLKIESIEGEGTTVSFYADCEAFHDLM